jgi:hypothetical protein
LVVLIAVIAVVVVLSIVPMLLRNPSPSSDESTNTPPTTAGPAPTSTEPTSNTVAPTLTSQPASPPPPPPPPPPASPLPALDAPVYVPQYQAPRGGSSEPAKPDIDVTRAPISVSPKPVTPPDSPRTGGGGKSYNTGWGW